MDVNPRLLGSPPLCVSFSSLSNVPLASRLTDVALRENECPEPAEVEECDEADMDSMDKISTA